MIEETEMNMAADAAVPQALNNEVRNTMLDIAVHEDISLGNEEENILNILNRLNTHNAWKLGHIFGPNMAVTICSQMGGLRQIEDLTSIPHVGQKRAIALIDYAWDIMMAKHLRKLERKAKRFERKSANRALYLPEIILKRYETGAGKQRWVGESELRSAGLLRLAIEHEFGPQTIPPLVSILNCLPGDQDNPDHADIAPSVWKRVDEFGLAVSGERNGIVKNSHGFPIINTLFPDVIDARAYNHSLGAPVMPGGILHDQEVVLTTLKTIDEDGVFLKDARTDGSGRIHPTHPLFLQMDRPNGACVVQFRFINRQGVFCKGILVPDERCQNMDGEPEIWIDWNQIKGAKKKLGQQRREEGAIKTITGSLGVIRLWDRRSTFQWCFEVLENLENCKENGDILKCFVDDAFDDLVEGGIEGILARIARDDERMDLIVKLLTAFKADSVDISPLQIPMVKNAIEDKLQRILWGIAQGSGQVSRQVVAVIDSAIPRGKVVVGGYKVGTKLACFRYPLVLAQGLCTFEVMKPYPHHCLAGKPVAEAIYMNPDDLFEYMQGDDDGDTIAITDNPAVVKLFERTNASGNVFLIEPEGEKFTMKTDSPEGLEYLRGKPRGPVGLMTIYRAQLLAVGDINGARAMSIMVQEAIDCAKKNVRWSNWKLATSRANWTIHLDGTWSFDIKLPESEYEDGDMPVGAIRDWVRTRLAQRGCDRKTGKNPLGWRTSDKRIHTSKWLSAAEQGQWGGGNLVHIVHDHAMRRWREIEDQFNMNAKVVPLNDLLPKLVASYTGMTNLKLPVMNWENYLTGLRERSGMRAFGRTMSGIMSQQLMDDNKFNRIEEATQLLQLKLRDLTIEQLLTIWMMETTSWFKFQVPDTNGPDPSKLITKYTRNPAGLDNEKLEQVNNPNHAFRAIAWPGSKVLTLLGLESGETCTFLNSDRIQKIVSIAAESDHPHQRLAEMVFNSTLHGKEQKDEDGQDIHGWQCKYCATTLQTALVRQVRSDRQHAENQFVATMIKTLNA